MRAVERRGGGERKEMIHLVKPLVFMPSNNPPDVGASLKDLIKELRMAEFAGSNTRKDKEETLIVAGHLHPSLSSAISSGVDPLKAVDYALLVSPFSSPAEGVVVSD